MGAASIIVVYVLLAIEWLYTSHYNVFVFLDEDDKCDQVDAVRLTTGRIPCRQ